jgi:hypothetical protein
MSSTFSRLLAALLAGGMLATAALAQGPAVSPYLPQPTTTTRTTANIVAVPASQPVPIVNVNGYSPNYGYYPSSPAGSYLSGRADVINARAQAAVTQQQAGLVQQDVYRSTLQSRNAMLDQARYERATTMNSEDVRIQNQIDALRRARNEPPLNEIWAATSLNALFDDIKKAHTYGVGGPTIPLDPNVLKHINVTTGVTAKGPAILKDGAKLRWPVVLQGSTFVDNRKAIETLTSQAVDQAKKGAVDLGLISQLNGVIEVMLADLKSIIADVEPGPYMEGKKFLRELNDGYASLKSPDVANYFNGTWSAQGSTVYELVDYMTKNGLRFGPAIPGDQSYYTAFYQSLLIYDVNLQTQAVKR